MDRNGGSDRSCHYSVLGVRKEASVSDIRTAYRRLAMKWHPDRWSKNPSLAGDANRRFQTIQEAYSVLSDERKRSMYDAGTLDLFDDDDDEEEMGEFMHDLLKMMDNNKRAAAAVGGEVRKEESLEDLQKCFMETFGPDLASYYPKNNTSTKPRTSTTPYARATPKRTATNSTSSSSSRSDRC